MFIYRKPVPGEKPAIVTLSRCSDEIEVVPKCGAGNRSLSPTARAELAPLTLSGIRTRAPKHQELRLNGFPASLGAAESASRAPAIDYGLRALIAASTAWRRRASSEVRPARTSPSPTPV